MAITGIDNPTLDVIFLDRTGLCPLFQYLDLQLISLALAGLLLTLAYHVSRWRHEPCINVSKVRAMQGARARVPVSRAPCARMRENQRYRDEKSSQ